MSEKNSFLIVTIAIYNLKRLGICFCYKFDCLNASITFLSTRSGSQNFVYSKYENYTFDL